MNTKATIFLILSGLLCLPLHSQSLKKADEGIDPMEIQKAIAEFNRLKEKGRAEANEVIVVLDPPEAPPMAKPVEAEEKESTEIPAGPGEETVEKPVLVTGKPPREEAEEEPADEAGSELAETAEETAAEDNGEVTAIEPESRPIPERKDPGLEVRVESIRQGSGEINPEEISLKASFPAKPLSEAPAGWVMARSEDAPEFKRNVELQPGTTIALSIRPHVLSPAIDGVANFAVREPGFETGEGYLQKNTVSAILGRSVVQLDEDSKKIGEVIEDLHLILASLPKPKSQPEDPDQP